MPITQITLLPGYPAEVRERLVERVSAAVRATIASPEAGTTTYVHEAVTYRRDGRVMTEGRAAQPVAGELVRAFLQAMEARDLERARTLLAPGFAMVFPGGAQPASLEELVARSALRYRHVAKRIERVDECWAPEGTVVYVFGTLYGQWPDGSAFEGVRFIDRFLVVEGAIAQQQVWNDLAEHRAAATPAVEPAPR
ncbi:MAG: nuclear transport factor 2 family protein [Rubrivivax sp.]